MNRCLERFVDPMRPRFSVSSRRRSSYNVGTSNDHLTRAETDEPHGADVESSSSSNPFLAGAQLLQKALGSESCSVVIFDTATAASQGPLTMTSNHSQSTPTNLSPVLASAYSSTDVEDLTSSPSVLLPVVEDLVSLIDRYPAGQLWTIEPNGDICLDQFSEGKNPQSHPDSTQRVADGSLLLLHFPRASCIFLRPIWNAQSSRMSVAIIYTISQYQPLTLEHDVPFINAFCNCIAMEQVRLAAVASDEQKSSK